MQLILLQPLDVGVLGPANKMWRRVVANWHKSGRAKQPIPKSVIPKLVKELCNKLNAKSTNLTAGFKACGIVPLDPQQVLKCLPPENQQPVQEALGQSVADLLRDNLLPSRRSVNRRGRRIVPRRAVTNLNAAASDNHNTSPQRQGEDDEESDNVADESLNELIHDISLEEANDDDETESEGETDQTDDEKKQGEVCDICKKWNLPGNVTKICWESCDKCQNNVWYHTVCLRKNNIASPEEICKYH